MYTERARTIVGAFCSISPESRILGGGEHSIDRASTFPFNARMFDPGGRNVPDSDDTGPTVIGNDVYIGVGAIVLSGVTIGDGAVVGAGAIVTSSVPAYAIVAGNPARVIRYRFDSETRARLLALEWWKWDDETIRAAQAWFMSDIQTFLDEAERARAI
jgi:acetyltransferase-like isoleucine patch superfamily enzyme